MAAKFKITGNLLHEIEKNLNSCGFHCLENVIENKVLVELSNEVKRLTSIKGNRYFSMVNVLSDDNLSFKLLNDYEDLNNLLLSIGNNSLKREVNNNDSLDVLRVVTGDNTDTQSLKFHYDAYSLTALFPIIIPDGPVEKSGHLVSFVNLRKLRSFFITNLIEKLFFQNLVTRKLLSKFVTLNLDEHIQVMKPGNVYLFWGYRTLHANLPVDPSYLRATLLYHVGEVHPKSFLGKVIKSIRHKSEKKIANK